jgi:protein TonB
VERKPQPVAAPSPDALASLRALAPPSPPRAAPAPARAAQTPSAPQAAPSAVPGDHVATLGTGSGGAGGDERGGGGAGTGDGSGGDGSDALARPAYGSNPKPPYPLAARRLGVEGVVTLDVLVRPDGSPAEVRVRSSSGSPLLDDSAVETVRSRWRFVPARRGNVPVESRVSFPIRFKLDAG